MARSKSDKFIFLLYYINLKVHGHALTLTKPIIQSLHLAQIYDVALLEPQFYLAGWSHLL